MIALIHSRLLQQTTRVTAALLAAAGLIAGLAPAARPVAAAGDCTVSAAQIEVDGEEARLRQMINDFRGANGLPALQESATLNRAAAWLALDSARRGFAPGDHIDTLGRYIPERVQDCGYPAGAYVRENDYYGGGVVDGIQKDAPEGAFHFWSVESEKHRDALLDPRVAYVGVGRECAGIFCYYGLDLGGEAGPAQAPAPAPAAWPVLRPGATGETVRLVQFLLGQYGHTVDVDGIYGPKTKQAVEAFQQQQGLSVDGIVGPHTWNALTPTLRRGSHNDSVRIVQSLLVERGADLVLDGIFGPKTDGAVRAFQGEAGLGVDGIVGPLTWRALLAGR